MVNNGAMQEADGTPSPDVMDGAMGRVGRTGLIAGISLFLIMLYLPAPGSMTAAAWRTAAVVVLMASWWVTEAIPIPATALLPLVLFPILGVAPIAKSSAPYANQVIFLFLGGFILAAGFERSGLHRRIAFAVVRAVGTKPANLVGGFMIATAAISMWVSNTATVLMMLPIATSVMSVIEEEEGEKREFAPLLLGIAYAASIGGLGTLIGTPPNALLAGFAHETLARRIDFVQWMALGVPLVVVSIPIVWFLLTRVLFSLSGSSSAKSDAILRERAAELGAMSRGEWITAAVVALTALAWLFEPLIERRVPAASDAGIAMTGGLLLFVVPLFWKDRSDVVTWGDVERLPWGVLVLFGGGLSLAAAIDGTGLAAWCGERVGSLGHISPIILTTVITTLVIFLTEFTSNTATAATFLPLVSTLAVGFDVDPLLLAIPATLAASCGFMMPVGTPPNALVYATGRFTILQMARAGIWINLLMVVLIDAATFLIAVPLFGLR